MVIKRHISHLPFCRVIWSFLALFLLMTPPAVRAAIFGGYSEYYIPGPEEQMWGVFDNLPTRERGGLNSAPGVHTVISITAS